MAEMLDLEIVTPDHEVVRAKVDEVEIPGKDGYIGVLPGHAALLSELGIGLLTYKAGGNPWYLAVHGGFLEILEDHVSVLADAAERAEEIDVARAQAAQRRAEEAASREGTGLDPALAMAALQRAQTRIDVAARSNSRNTAGAAKH